MPQTGSTLAEMQKHDTESFAPAVIDEIINRDPITTRVPYLTLGGTQFRYLRESTNTEPEFFTLDEELIENNPTVTEVTLTLKQIGQNADTEGFATTLESRKSQRGYVLLQVAKGMMEKIGERFVYGNNTVGILFFSFIFHIAPIIFCETLVRTDQVSYSCRLSDLLAQTSLGLLVLLPPSSFYLFPSNTDGYALWL